MGSIRPLFTITVLVVVGAYLYVKINEGPVRPHAGGHDAGNQLADGVPPLAATGGGATLAQDSAAPAWPPVQSTAAPAAPNTPFPPAAPVAGLVPVVSPTPGSAPAAADTAKNGFPDVPPIPELPELPVTADVTPPATNPAALPTELPKDIPTAQYPDLPGPSFNTGIATDAANSSTPLQTNASVSAASGPANISTAPIAPGPLSTSPPISNQALPPHGPTGFGATQLNSPAASDQNPLRPAANSTPEAGTSDRYGPSQTPALQPAIGTPSVSQPSAPAGPSFAASWPTIQTALDRGDLKQAHQLLSKWHSDESLVPADAQKVETLLSQLAGTVIYSAEHQLEPARVVRQGETLESIAKEYNVPWQLLAKINGVPAVDQLRPGQPLKVVRGPFSAVVDLHRNELTLEVDGRYAGKFPVSVPTGATVTDGQWLVDQKLGGAQIAAKPAVYGTASATADRTIILRNATDPGSPGGQTLTIASGSAPGGPTAGSAAIHVAPQDAEEISDILSIGSRVVVRR